MAQVGKIRCDLCGFIGDLETFNGKAQMRTPAGWASVHTTVRIAGERNLEKDELKTLKAKIAEQFPALHACPGCCQSHRFYEASKMIPLKGLKGELMKHKLHYHLNGAMHSVSYKIKAMSRLIENFVPGAVIGDENEISTGIGMILEEIAAEAASVSSLLDTNDYLITRK